MVIVIILLMTIGCYFINGYCGYPIDEYSIGEYQCLLMVIILAIICGYSIGGYWCLLMVIILVTIVAIILMVIDGYFICYYWWLLMLLY